MLDYDFMESEITLSQCVNPHEINPMDSYICPAKIGSIAATLQASSELEMEKFSDLSMFLPKKASTPKHYSEDELNTPVFDIEKQFDFTVPSVNSSDRITEKSDYPSHYELCNNNDNIMHVDSGVSTIYEKTGSPTGDPEKTNLVYNNISHQNKNIIISMEKENSNSLNTPMYEQAIEDHDYGRSSTMLELVESEFIDSDISSLPSPTEVSGIQDNISMLDTFVRTKPNLQLSVGIKFFQDDINTPDIIDAVDSLETEAFNILTYIKEEQPIPAQKEDELQFPSPSLWKTELIRPEDNEETSVSTVLRPEDNEETSVSTVSNIQQELEESSFSLISNHPEIDESHPKRTRKRKHYDSDDDYVPPTKIKSSLPEIDYSTDSNDSYIPPPKRRGRPPGRRISTVSHTSSASACSLKDERYREVRDKNNEASRKSRLKRRIKEQQLEEEADQLHERNIKLKTEVAQLEKLVKSFKDNLFSLILKK